MAMRFEFDSEVNALYVRINDGEVDRTVEVDESMFIDLDEHGKTLGFEFLNANDFLAFNGRHGGNIQIPEQIDEVTDDLLVVAG